MGARNYDDGVAQRFFEQPILNSPYEYPARHWELDENRQPTNKVVDRRRTVSFITPIPAARKRRAAQSELGLDDARTAAAEDGQQYELMRMIESVRHSVNEWRRLPRARWRVTPETARLLQHWRHHQFSDMRPFFCQVEAVETVIWLTEVAAGAGREGRRFVQRLQEANEQANPGLPRLALKLATGAGKTTVMAMLIAWQTVNAVRHPGSGRFTRGFLVVTPGLTIRDRLRVLQPNDPDSYYASRELVPRDMLGDLHRATIVITNYHAFMARETQDISRGGRALLQGRGPELHTLETEGQVLQRVMPGLLGMKHIMAFNDEAHHCYREKPKQDSDEAGLTADDRQEARKNSEAARVWISGLETVQRRLSLSRVIDLSATPFFLRGSGYAEGTLFPWTMSDFSLMDAIECGIVKLPRVPVADNIPSGEMPTFRNLWQHIGKQMPRKGRAKAAVLDPLSIPTQLKTALDALYGHYEKVFDQWREAGIEVPPCFIVVCNNTATSKLVYDYISGFHRQREDGSASLENGRLELFRNFDDHGNPLARPHTLLIDSEQLDSGEGLGREFRGAASDEIERFRREIVARTGDRRQAENLSDQDLLREVMNTVGVAGRLGGATRCVVSVSMLTEGWDARTVTHILGVRAFGTQLLCEQVVGRALRRQSYDLNEEGVFNVEYADVLGIPFDFTAQPVAAKQPKPRETVAVRAITPDRDACEIRFPRVQGYRVELPEEKVDASVRPMTPPWSSPRNIIGPIRHPQCRHHRRGRRPEPDPPPRPAPRHAGLPPHQDPAGEVARARPGAEAAPVRSAQAGHPPLAGRSPDLQGRHLSRPAHVPGAGRPGVHPHHARHHGAPSRGAPGHRGTGPLQPDRLHHARQLHHLQADPLANRPPPLPRELGGVRQRVGGGVLPLRRVAAARPRLRQEPRPGAGGSLPVRRRGAHLPARLHRAGGRRPRRR